MNLRPVVIAKTATFTLGTVRIEIAEFVVHVKKINVDKRNVANVEFARKISVLTAMNFAPFALNVRMKNASLQLNAVMKSLVVPVRIVKMELVWIETVGFVVIAIL